MLIDRHRHPSRAFLQLVAWDSVIGGGGGPLGGGDMCALFVTTVQETQGTSIIWLVVVVPLVYERGVPDRRRLFDLAT